MIHFHFVYPWFKFLLFIHLNFNQLSIHYPPSLKSMIKMYFLFLFISPPKNNKKLGQSNIRLRGQLSSFLDLSLTHSIVSLRFTPLCHCTESQFGSFHSKNPDRPLSLLQGFSFFLLLFCFWVVGLIMIWLWWGYGLWLVVVMDCGRGGGGAKLWVLIVVVEKKSPIIYDNFLPRFGVFQKQMTSLRSQSNSD